MDTATLRMQLGLATYVMQKNTDGLTHEESLIQPPSGGNCANWVLGHMVRTRNAILPMLGKEPLFAEERFDAYDREPITGATEALPWTELLDAYARTTEPLQTGLSRMTNDQLAESAPLSPTGNPDETVGSLLAAIAFHEAYHAGQIGLLRRIAGKPGAVEAPRARAR